MRVSTFGRSIWVLQGEQTAESLRRQQKPYVGLYLPQTVIQAYQIQDKQSSTSTPRIQGISSASAPARRRLPSHGKTPSARTSVDLSSPASLPSAPWASNNITGIPDRTIPEPVFDNSAFEPNRTLPLDDLNSQILDDANWTNPWFDAQFFDLEPSVYYAQGNNSCGFVSEQPNIIDEVDRVAFQASTEVDPEQMSGIEAIDER